MRLKFLLACPVLLSPLFAQEEPTQPSDDQEARVIGKITDGTVEAPAPKELPDFHVLKTKTIADQGRTISICRVATPDLPAPPTTLAPEEMEEYVDSEEFQNLQEHHQQSEFCAVSATVYDHNRTLVRWWPPGAQEPCECWSNIDFNLLSGFNEFEGRGQKYVLIMGLGNISAEQWEAQRQRDPENAPEIPNLPDVEEQGPLYMVTVGDTEDAQAMKVMDVLHDLYEDEEARLKEAHELRKQNRQQREAELAANPPQPKDTVIYYWPKKSRWHGVQEEGGTE